MEEILKYIPVTMDITQDQFIKDYKGIVRKALNEARSYVQSEGKKAARGKVFDLVLRHSIYKDTNFVPYNLCITEWWLVDKNIPSVEEILLVCKTNNPEAIAEGVLKNDPVAIRNKEILTWYANTWLPCASGSEYYNDKISSTFTYRDQVMIGTEAKVRVTISSEAFGLLQLDNCSVKWPAMFAFKELHGEKKEIPRKDKAAEPFKAKYSDGGWSAAGLRKKYNSIVNDLVCYRQRDVAMHDQMANYMRELCKEKQGVKPTANGKRARTVGDTPQESPIKVTRIME